MFEEFMGRRQGEISDDPLTRKGVELWLRRVLAAYGDGGVDVEIIDGQLLLNAKTADYIYSDFTPDEIKYVAGCRPMLEQVVAENVTDSMSDRDKALALMRRCRDNRDNHPESVGFVNGGTEEELLKAGALMCNLISRVFVCLCQVAGLPARVFSSHITGHMMSEVKVDGKWWWIDSMKGIAPVGDDDQPVSAWELFNDTLLFERQPQSVIDDCRPPGIVFGDNERDPQNIAYCLARNRDCYFHPREAMAVGNYYVWEHDKYTYPWLAGLHDPQEYRQAMMEENRNRKAAGWPDWFFCADLFDEELKTR